MEDCSQVSSYQLAVGLSVIKKTAPITHSRELEYEV
jgi:hypothetical protein